MCTRELDGKTVEFGTTGYTMDHVFVLYDRDSDSVWYPMSDNTFDAVAGDRRGESIPFLDEPAPMPLSAWLVMHPLSEILLPTEEEAEALRALANRPYMGVQLGDAETGVLISGVVDDTPAQAAGLQEGDVITGMDGEPVTNRSEMQAIIRAHEPGDVVEIIVRRDGEPVTVELEFGRRE